MNTFPVLVSALGVFALCYRYYSAFIAAKALALDDRRITPAHTLKDGHNYVPSPCWVLFGHDFAASPIAPSWEQEASRRKGGLGRAPEGVPKRELSGTPNRPGMEKFREVISSCSPAATRRARSGDNYHRSRKGDMAFDAASTRATVEHDDGLASA